MDAIAITDTLQPDASNWWLWLAAGSAGLAITTGLLLISAAVGIARRRLNGVAPRPGPVPSRTWRLVRAACETLSPVMQPLLPVGTFLRIRDRLRRAGLEQVIDPPAFVAGQLLCAAGAGLAVAMVTITTDGARSWVLAAAVAGWFWPASVLVNHARRRQSQLRRDLPAILDLLCIALDAGASLQAGLAMIAERGPKGALRDEVARLLREVHAGRSRQEALQGFADRIGDPGVSQAVAAIRAADRQGGDVTAMLRDQSDQRRQERFIEAERRAMQAPVKLLLPLLLFIFPGTFLILLFPIAMRLLAEGLI